MPRNKVILNTLYKSKDVEVFGSGFRKVYALCDKDNIKVEAIYENDGFSFLFYRDIKPHPLYRIISSFLRCVA